MIDNMRVYVVLYNVNMMSNYKE